MTLPESRNLIVKIIAVYFLSLLAIFSFINIFRGGVNRYRFEPVWIIYTFLFGAYPFFILIKYYKDRRQNNVKLMVSVDEIVKSINRLAEFINLIVKKMIVVFLSFLAIISFINIFRGGVATSRFEPVWIIYAFLFGAYPLFILIKYYKNRLQNNIKLLTSSVDEIIKYP